MFYDIGSVIMPSSNPVGEAIHRQRRLRGWTQGQLADRVGVSQAHVSNIETGRSTDYESSRALCEELELDYKRLMGEWIGAVSPVESAIKDDPALRDDHRHLLLVLYRAMRDQGPLGTV